LPDTGIQNIFIAKYDSTGNFKWARFATDNCSCNTENLNALNTLASDSNENIIAGGRFSSSQLFFDSATILSHSAFCSYPYGFIAKFDSSGQIKWAKAMTMGGGTFLSVTTDLNLNIYTTGFFNGNAIFDSDTISNLGSYYSGLPGVVFLAKLDTLGNIIKIVAGGGTSIGSSISVTNNGHVYISGKYLDTLMTFGDFFLENDFQDYLLPINYCFLISTDTQLLLISETKTIKKDEISVFPNPATNEAIVRLPQSATQGTICLYDIAGRIMQSKKVYQGDVVLNLQDYSPGLYFVHFYTEEENYYFKLLIQ